MGRGRGDYGRTVREATLLTLKVEEEEAGAKECRWPPGTAKGKEMDSPLQSPKGMQPHLISAH